ncbi:MAG: 30S ribosomal protein S17, partial [Patescibacteria group bacterium]
MATAKTKTVKQIIEKPAIISRKFSGVVVSDKNDKTIIVKVESVKKHPKYQKRYVSS